MFLEFVIVSISILLIIYLYFKKKYCYFKDRNIPYMKPEWIFGNTKQLLLGREMISEPFRRVYDRFPDVKICGAFFGPIPVYVVRDPDLILDVLIKNFSSFTDHGFGTDVENDPLDSNLFLLHGTKWKMLRRKLSPAFTSGKIKWMYHLMEECVSHLTQILDNEVGNEVEIAEALCKLTTDVIGSCGFGIDVEALKNPDNEFRRIGKQATNPGYFIQLKNTFRMLFPKLFNSLKLKVLPEEMRQFFIGMTKSTFEHRLRSGEKRNDFLQLLLQLREKGEIELDQNEVDEYFEETVDEELEDTGKFVITDQVLTAQLLLFFTAGFETSASSMTFVVYMLMTRPDVQEKLRQEIKRISSQHGGINYTSIQAMQYLDACIKETMRIHSPIQLLMRKCTKSCTLEDGTHFEKGAIVYLSVSGLHMDPKHFPQPENFRPERFLEGTPRSGTYMPFGDGPRICIAKRFAMLEMKLTIAKIVDRFRIHSCPTMKRLEPLTYRKDGFFLRPSQGIWCTLEKLS